MPVALKRFLIVCCIVLACAIPSLVAYVAAPALPKVILIQDGGVEDYFSTVLLAAEHKKKKIDFLGEVMVDGDSMLPFSMEVGYKIHTLLDMSWLPLTLSYTRALNAFPYDYRRDCAKMMKLPSLKDVLPTSPMAGAYPDGDQWLQKVLEESDTRGLTIVCTSALTPLWSVLRSYPHLSKKIKELVWMGGAVSMPGNLDRRKVPEWNTKAEWNVYSDPVAAAWIFQNTKFPIYMFPLDISDQTPITNEFMQKLKTHALEEGIARAAYESYLMDIDNPYYRLWDTVATAYIGRPDLFEDPISVRITIDTAYDTAGWTRPDTKHGRGVFVFFNFTSTGLQGIYDYVADPMA